MTLKSLIDEGFDISKSQQARSMQKNIEAINAFVAANRDAASPIAKEASNLNVSFASLLAAAQSTLEQEAADQKKKDLEDRKKKDLFSRSRAGVGTTLPIEKSSDSKEPDKTR